MIDFLEDRTLLNKIELKSDFIKKRIDYDYHAIQYMKEIPPNFIGIQFKRNKKELITNHLKTLYQNVSDEMVENVLSRVINLIKYVTSNDRKDYEDFSKQHKFKEKNWDRIKRCEVCGFKFRILSDTSLEHVLPLSLGGPDNDTNWQLLCKDCNGQKSNFWGLSDLRLVDQLTSKDLLKATSIEEVKDLLPKNIRYFVIEYNKRQCSHCKKSSLEVKLEVEIKFNTVINIDSFSTICEECIKANKIKKDKIL